MKKILFAVSLFAVLFVACDPAIDEIAMDANVTAEELTNSFQLVPKNAGNNNITVNLNTTRYVKVYSADNDALIVEGTQPKIQVVPPAREVSYYISTINQDGSVIKSSSKSVQVTEFTDLPAIYYQIFGADLGTTTWTWDDGLDRYWGNSGWGSGNTGPSWWGAPDNTTIDEQAVGKGMPNDGLGAWFSISLSEGVNTSRGEKGTVSVSADVAAADWDLGTMKFSGTVPLLGVLPNDNNQRCYTYQIIKADGDHLVLAAASSSGWEGWFFCYKKISNK
ncbi:hypothetical protein [Bacteroides helcogenes]|uniref:Lipoprotein n=1 Tax=Bacteroides helcogenes (strain ATCC 35417 / DSM 20613 / JCM 6297 / CCUG 15421 / P 36-108) TaxID=693979 RepID=E6STD0_BACT6|nr:hypothetical protein [Bacteroides helcogenes]ADV42261.1 hypothetical protein Bache_0231 [Bacteroides helcogenes P 36-108]MDY5237285.1 hypothetical protein [Bacteroides helcogenes]